jgi:hypothetical protein
LVDSSAQTNAEAGPASAGRDGAGPERVDDGPADRQLTAAGASSNTQPNGHSSNQGSPGVGNGESSRTTNDGADAPKRSATPISSSHLPPAQTIPSGSVIQQMLVNLSDREIAARALVGSGAQAIAVSSAAGRQQDTSLAAVPGNVDVSGGSTIAPVNQKPASNPQKSIAQENGGWVRGESFGATNVELPKAVISPATLLISAATTVLASGTLPLDQTISSSNTGFATTQPAEQAPISLSPQSSSPENSPMPVVASSAIGNGDGWRGALIDASAINPSAALVSDTPAKPLVQDSPSGNTSPGIQTNEPVLQANGNSVFDPGGNTNAQAVAENPTAPQQDVALPPVNPGKVTTEQSLGGQKNGSSTNDRSVWTSTESVAVHAAPAVQNLASQLLASRPVTELAASERPTSTPKAPSPTSTQTAAVDDRSAAPVVSKSVPDNQPSTPVSAAEQVLILPIGLPTAEAPMSSPNGNQAADNGAPKGVPGSNGSGNPLFASKSDSATSNTANSANGSGEGSSQGGQNAQSFQNSQVDPSRTVEAASRTSDNGAFQAQTQAVPTQAAFPESATVHRVSDAPNPPSLPGDHQDNPASIHSDSGEAVAASSINTAKLLQTMSETEMHVGMRSTEFGDISIRTSVSQQQMVTQISLDHGDLSQAISAHVSTMQAKLGEEYGLHASIEVHNLGSSLAGDSGQSSHGEQRAFSHSARSDSNPFQPEEEAGLSLAAMAVAGNGNRLDIRA